jgi:hypothetical protein
VFSALLLYKHTHITIDFLKTPSFINVLYVTKLIRMHLKLYAESLRQVAVLWYVRDQEVRVHANFFDIGCLTHSISRYVPTPSTHISSLVSEISPV